jgi:hypothetical protein
MTTSHTEKLEAEIEQVVRKHLAAYYVAAMAAVGRAFASTSPRVHTSGAKRRTPGRRRPPDEVAALAERLYEAVCAHPGETMAVIAPQVGESARALNRPMTHLKRAGRVRSAGQRHMTRYFPLSS